MLVTLAVAGAATLFGVSCYYAFVTGYASGPREGDL